MSGARPVLDFYALLDGPLGRFSRDIRDLSVCLSVCLSTFGKLASWWTGDLWLKSVLLILIGSLLEVFVFMGFQWSFFAFKLFLFFWSLWTSLLCIVGELERGRYVVISLSVKHDTWHKTFFHFFLFTYIFCHFLFVSCPFWYWCYYPQTLKDLVCMPNFCVGGLMVSQKGLGFVVPLLQHSIS